MMLIITIVIVLEKPHPNLQSGDTKSGSIPCAFQSQETLPRDISDNIWPYVKPRDPAALSLATPCFGFRVQWGSLASSLHSVQQRCGRRWSWETLSDLLRGGQQ